MKHQQMKHQQHTRALFGALLMAGVMGGVAGPRLNPDTFRIPYVREYLGCY